MTRIPFLLALALAFSIASASSALAAPPWSSPQAIPGSVLEAPRLEFGPRGEGLAWWPRHAAAIAPDGSLAPRRKIASGFAADLLLAIDGAGRMVGVGSAAGAGRSDVASATGSADGRLGRPRRFMPRAVAGRAAASNARGDAAVIAQVSRKAPDRRSRRAVYLSVRPAGGRFSRPQRLAAPRKPAALAVAIGERGEVLAAWTQSGRVYARLRSASGRLGRPHRIAYDPAVRALRAGLTESGHGAVAWTSHLPGGESSPPGEADVRLVVRPAGRAFGRQRRLDHIGSAGSANVDVVASARDRITIAWNGDDAGRRDVRVAEVEDGAPGPVHTVSPPGAALVSLDAAAHGAVVAFGVRSGGEPGFERHTLMAAVRPAGAAAFGPAEQISGSVRFFGGDVAVDPASGRVIAAWAQLDGRVGSVQSALRSPLAR